MKRNLLVLGFFCSYFLGVAQQNLVEMGYNSKARYAIAKRDGAVSADILQVEKPVIFIEGLDASNSYSCQDMYMYANGLTTSLNQAGHDVIFLNFINGGKDIRYNSEAVTDLIKLILSSGHRPDITVIGYSMGGLVARYAISELESEGYPHRVKTFISYDSPNRGANIPVPMISLFNMFPSDIINALDPDARDARINLSSYAAKQMLIYYSIANKKARPHSYHNTFFSELESMGCGGYPEHSRNVAVSIGSFQGFGMRKKNGAFLHSGEDVLDIGGLVFAGKVATISSDKDPNITYWTTGAKKVVDISWPSSVEIKTDKTLHYPIDVAPGSYSNIYKSVCSSIDDLWVENCESSAKYATFIPSISALDFSTDDFFYDLSSDYNRMDKTPFEAIFGIDRNDVLNHGKENGDHTVPGYMWAEGHFIFNHITNTLGSRFNYTVLANTMIDETFENLIATDFVVPVSTEARLKDYESIIFKPGVIVEKGAVMHAEIVGRSKACGYDPANRLGTFKNDNESFIEEDVVVLEGEEGGLEIYPNPSNGNVVLKTTQKVANIVMIYDVSGRVVREIHDLPAGSSIDLTNLDSGTYLVKVIGENDVVHQGKLVLQ